MRKIFLLFLIISIVVIFSCSSSRLHLHNSMTIIPNMEEIMSNGYLIVTDKNDKSSGPSRLLKEYKEKLSVMLHIQPSEGESMSSISGINDYINNIPKSVNIKPDITKQIMESTGKKYLIFSEIGENEIEGTRFMIIAVILYPIVVNTKKKYTHPHSRFGIIDMFSNTLIFDAYYQSDSESKEFADESIEYFMKKLTLKGGKS